MRILILSYLLHYKYLVNFAPDMNHTDAGELNIGINTK